MKYFNIFVLLAFGFMFWATSQPVDIANINLAYEIKDTSLLITNLDEIEVFDNELHIYSRDANWEAFHIALLPNDTTEVPFSAIRSVSDSSAFYSSVEVLQIDFLGPEISHLIHNDTQKFFTPLAVEFHKNAAQIGIHNVSGKDINNATVYINPLSEDKEFLFYHYSEFDLQQEETKILDVNDFKHEEVSHVFNNSNYDFAVYEKSAAGDILYFYSKIMF